MIEKRWLAAGPSSVTGAGSTLGKLPVTSTLGFKVKMWAVLTDPIQPDLKLEIKRVNSATEIVLGPIGGKITDRTDISAYGVASTLYAYEQPRNTIPLNDEYRATYEEEPTVAWRVITVDPFGDFWNDDNPFPVKIKDVQINLPANLHVQLTHLDNDPNFGDVHDSVRVGDGVEELAINPDGSINVVFTPSGTGTAVDEAAQSFVAIDNSSFTEIIKVSVGVDETFYLQEICISLRGFTAEFVIEYYNGATTTVVRRHIISTQQSTFTEIFGRPRPFIGGASNYVRITAQMIGVNQTGFGFGSINGYKI